MKTLALLSLVLLVGAAQAQTLLKAGDRFPAWSMTDHEGRTVTSADLAGTTYLLWYYPKAMTSGCTTEGCTLRDNFAAFQDNGIEILGVSFDDPKTNAEFVAKERFQFRLLTDSDRKLAVAVGAAAEPGAGWAKRISYLVGRDGTVLRVYGSVKPAEHAGQVLADFAAIKSGE
jgi:peroxiredoxin Q/BCP